MKQVIRFAATIAAAAILAGATGLGATAQTAQQDVEARTERVQPRPEAFDGPSVQFTSQRPPANAEEISFDLNDVVIEGATLYENEALAALYKDKTGGEVTLLTIFDIAGAIQKLYREDDYVFTRVVVPAQSIEGGVVRIEVIEATIETVAVEEPEESVGPVSALVEDMIAPLIGLTNPTGAFLERTLLNINEIPGMRRATAVPQAGASGNRGALALFINVERDPFEAIIFGDNRQVPGVGRGIFGGSATFNSWSRAGDTTTISYFNSFGYLTDEDSPPGDGGVGDLDERNTFQLEHSRYLGDDGLQVKGRVLFSRTRPGDDLAEIGLEGETLLAGIEASYPLLRTRRTSLTGAIGVDLYNSETDVSQGAFNIADDRLRLAFARFDGLIRDSLGYTKFTVEGRQGLKVLNASDPVTDDFLSRNDGRGDFSTLSASIERLIEVNEDLSLFLKAAGQISATPLLASEEFAIGGLTYGRGFDPSEYTGDDGFGLSGEVRFNQTIELMDQLFDAEFYAFTDYGYVRNKGLGQPGSREIASAGGGVRLFLPDQYVLGLEAAYPLNRPLERTQNKNARYFVNFSKRF